MRFSLVPILTLAALTAGAQEPLHPIADKLQPFVDEHSLAGAVTMVASKDKVLDVEAVGYADVAAQKKMTPDALFWIASMSKPITSTALMMLVDEGKVNVDDPVEKYLPEFKGQKVAAKKGDSNQEPHAPKHPILVRNILSHTSGLDFKSSIEQPTLDQKPLRERVASYAAAPLLFEPDSDYKYANEGINTAGRIIEVVSGMPYEEFLQKRLFDPLGMKDTTFWPTEEQEKRIAKSYRPTADQTNLEETPISQLAYPLHDHTRQPMPAGGLFSTAADVTRFAQMILNGGELNGHRFLSQKALQMMTSRQTGPDLKASYGFGWQVNPNGSFGHGGAYATNMTVDGPHGIVTVFMVQHAGWPNKAAGKPAAAFNETALKDFAEYPPTPTGPSPAKADASAKPAPISKNGPKWHKVNPQTPAGITMIEREVAPYPEHNVTLTLYIPHAPGPYPCILDIHGGGWSQRQVEADKPMMERLATRGYVTALVSYRLSGEAKYPAALTDCKSALRYLRAHAAELKIEPNRIGCMGGSAGGHLSGLTAMSSGLPQFEGDGPERQVPSTVKACIVMAATQDLTAPNDKGPAPSHTDFFGATIEEKPDLYKQASPITHVRPGVPPVCYIEGEKDTRKIGRPEMQEKLRAFGIPTELHTLPEAPHPFWMSQPWLDETVEIADAWFKKFL